MPDRAAAHGDLDGGGATIRLARRSRQTEPRNVSETPGSRTRELIPAAVFGWRRLRNVSGTPVSPDYSVTSLVKSSQGAEDQPRVAMSAQIVNFARHPAAEAQRMRAHSARSTTVLIGLVLIAAIVLVVGARVTAVFPGSVGAAAVVVVAALVFVWLIRTRRTEQRAATWAAGALGEELVATELARLPDDFVVLNNLPLAGRGDVDHVVVGPGGVVVIETKYLAGHVVCLAPGKWVQTKRGSTRAINDPAVQVANAAARIGGILRDWRYQFLHVRPMVVFAHPRAELATQASSVSALPVTELLAFLLRHGTSTRVPKSTVNSVADCLTTVAARELRRRSRHRTRGQALVETALALPVVLMLGLGVLGVARVSSALMGVTVAAREAALAAALAPDAATAWSWGTTRGRQVAAEYGLNTSSASFLVDVDVSSFEWWGEVRASVTYAVSLADIPLVPWAQVQVPLQRSHAEVLDPYRSSQ